MIKVDVTYICSRCGPWRSDMEADLCPDCWEAVYKYARTKP